MPAKLLAPRRDRRASCTVFEGFRSAIGGVVALPSSAQISVRERTLLAANLPEYRLCHLAARSRQVGSMTASPDRRPALQGLKFGISNGALDFAGCRAGGHQPVIARAIIIGREGDLNSTLKIYHWPRFILTPSALAFVPSGPSGVTSHSRDPRRCHRALHGDFRVFGLTALDLEKPGAARSSTRILHRRSPPTCLPRIQETSSLPISATVTMLPVIPSIVLSTVAMVTRPLEGRLSETAAVCTELDTVDSRASGTPRRRWSWQGSF